MSITIPIVAADGAKSTVTLPAPVVAQPSSGSNLGVGFTHTQPTPSTLTSAAQSAFLATPVPQAQSIMGWGPGNPEPSPGVYDFSSLDPRINYIKACTGSPAVITLCAAPDWMKGGTAGSTDWSKIEVAPLSSHYSDFANLCATIAKRYPQVRHFQVWNEFKGFWNASLNRWNYEAYTTMYNLVYDALKAVDPGIQVGGPYIHIDTTYQPSQELKGVWGAADQRSLDVVKYWLANKHGADFIVVDVSATGNPDAFTSNTIFSDTNTWLRTQTNLPIWYAEWYPSYPSGAGQNAAFATALIETCLIPDATLFRWDFATSDSTALFDSSGNPTALLTQVLQRFQAKFPPGTPRRRATAPATLRGLVGNNGQMVIVNITSGSVTGTVEGQQMTLSAYEVRWI